MNYLCSFLVGEAESTVKGLKLSNDNYSIAKRLLEERYGDPQVLISAHISKLLNLDSVKNITNVKELRCLYDEVETQVRSLNCLGVNSNNYGPMLVPVLFSKIPEELKLIISRKFGKDLWDIQSVLESLKLEVEAREKICTQDSNSINQPFTGMSLYTSNYENNKHFLHENRNTSSYDNNKQFFNENRNRGINTQFQPHSYSNSGLPL